MITALALLALFAGPPAAMWWYARQQGPALGEAYRDENNNHDIDPL